MSVRAGARARHGRALAGACAAVVLGALSACASAPPPAAPGWVSGRLSVRVDATGTAPASAFSADFELRGDGDAGELRLSSPIGSRLAQARWSPTEAVLDTGGGGVRYPDLDTLSRAALGEALPLRALPDWLAGRPWPRAASSSRPEGFEQLGWTIRPDARPGGRLEAERLAPPRVVVRVVREQSAP